MDLSNAQLGRLGETAVAMELMKRGYDVVNLNDSIKNIQSVDLLCMKGRKRIFIQVKTGTEHNILTGLTSTTNGIIQNVESKIACPWVFVKATPKGDIDYDFEFYVLTQEETLELITTSNDWYANQWGRKLKCNILVGVEVKWLCGKGESAKGQRQAYMNPLKVTSKDKWDKLEF